MKIALIPTGVMELVGLARSLQRCFGDEHEFVAIPKVPEAPGVSATPFAGFTSDGVDRDRADDASSAVCELAQELVLQVYPRTRRGRGERAADLAIVLDDLELENIGAEAMVAETFRAAVKRQIETTKPADRVELRRCLRNHGSFHIVSAMAESWFFADPNGMRLNHVPVGRPVRMVNGIDPERFETDDPAYLVDDGSACTGLIAEVLRRKKQAQYKRAPWVTIHDPRHPHRTRARHPKHYLEWLCRDPADKRCTTWRERSVGGQALAQLDWAAVLSNDQHCAFARSFLEDIATAIGAPTPGLPDGRHEALTRWRAPHLPGVLRNL